MPFYVVIVFSFFILFRAEGAQVLAVNGSKVTVIPEDGDLLFETEKYFVLNAQNKRVGIISITSSTDTESQAELLKGSARKGYKLVSYEKPGTKAAAPVPPKDKPAQKSSSKLGVHFEFMLNTMSVKVGGNSLALAGSSIALAVAYQHAISENFKARYPIGFRSYSVKASNSVCTGGSCDLSVSYISLGAYLDYFMTDSISIATGYEYLSPSAKSSSFLASSQIEANSVLSLGIGWLANSRIPISVSYNMFLNNKEIPASYISLQTGYLWSF